MEKTILLFIFFYSLLACIMLNHKLIVLIILELIMIGFICTWMSSQGSFSEIPAIIIVLCCLSVLDSVFGISCLIGFSRSSGWLMENFE